MGVVEDVIYGCVKGLDRRILDCKLAIHDNCLDKIRKNMIYHLVIRHTGMRNRSDETSLDSSTAVVVTA